MVRNSSGSPHGSEKIRIAVELVDPALAPRTADYLRGLPNGLESYPECQVRSELTREIFKRFPATLTAPGVTPELAKRLRQESDAGDWMSDTLGVVARILVRDVAIPSDEELDRWAFDVAGEIFARPIYRVLMYVLSPTLVLMGATKRWAAFRKGTTLTSTFDRNSAIAELKYPKNLYTPLVLRGFGHAFRASLTAARATNPTIELVEAGPERARWTVEWR